MNIFAMLFFSIVIVTNLVVYAQQPVAVQPIKIGYSLVATDPAGQPPLKAIHLAIQEINNAGGVLGRPLEVVVAYNATKDYTKVQGIVEDMAKKNVVAIIPSGGSAMTLKTSEYTIPKGILTITASSSSPKISTVKDNDILWRTIPSDVFQGRLAAKYLDSLKFKNVGIIYVDNPYGNGLAEVFTKEFTKRGGKVIATIAYKEMQEYKTTNFVPSLTTLYKQKPDAIYMITYGEDGAAILNQSYTAKLVGEKSYKPFFLGCDANYNNDLLLGVESWERMEGMRGLVYAHPKQYPNFDNFYERYNAFVPPSDSADVANASLATLLNIEATKSYAATAYDAVYLLAYAMIKANSTDSKKVAAALRNVAKTGANVETINVREFAKAVALLRQGKDINYDGASGFIEFDENGDVTSGTYTLWKISKGEFVNESALEEDNTVKSTLKK
jgi:ABC-type branched-subunit amino acid transport system substrate-binding protein